VPVPDLCLFLQMDEVTKSRWYSADDEPFVGVEMGFAETCLVPQRSISQAKIDFRKQKTSKKRFSSVLVCGQLAGRVLFLFAESTWIQRKMGIHRLQAGIPTFCLLKV
jgi:hypothetical protein